MTEKQIGKLAKDLYNKILEAYKANPDITYTEVLNEHLLPFNDKVGSQLTPELSNIINSSVGGLSSTIKPLTDVALSSTLYKNSQYVAGQVMKTINEQLVLKSTINEIRKAVYDGYGYESIEGILNAVNLPKYLTKNLTESQIRKLSTKSLAAGYFNVLDATTEKQLAKALKIAAEEKARYYALRIAQTEEQKAFNQMLAGEYLTEGVEYVKVTLSSRHSTPCVCDYYANYNNGYGGGVYKLRDAPMPPFHPFCKCVLRPFDNARWREAKTEGFLSKYTKQQKIDMLRGRDSKWGVPTVGEAF